MDFMSVILNWGLFLFPEQYHFFNPVFLNHEVIWQKVTLGAHFIRK